MKLAILSDIHANLTAFEAVIAHIQQVYGDQIPIASLGDVIDYGMRPNETLELLKCLGSRLIVNLAGNHEMALMGYGVDRFSSERGLQANQFTKSILNEDSWLFIKNEMQQAFFEAEFGGRKLLFIHGDLSDNFWGKMSAEESNSREYEIFHYVFSGHTHRPFLRETFFKNDQNIRPPKKTIFINPGSVGQPRNSSFHAQYVFIDTQIGTVHFNSVPYNIEIEIALFQGEISPYYGERLLLGV